MDLNQFKFFIKRLVHGPKKTDKTGFHWSGNTLPSRCLRYRPRGVVQVRGVSRIPIVSTNRGNSCDKKRTTPMSCAQEELDV